MRPKVYLSGPITKGDWDTNFHQAADAQRVLIATGYAVLNPMLTMRLHPTTGLKPDLDDEHPTPAVVPYTEEGYAVLDELARMPTTSAWMESAVKDMNYRIKGTEMFWNNPAGAEAMSWIPLQSQRPSNCLQTQSPE